MYSFLEQTVADHMTRDVKTVTRSVTLRELGDLFEKDDFNAYPVEENVQVVGVVSKFDHLACFVFTPAHMMPRYDDLMKRTVADIMTSDFIYVATDTRLTRVLQLMVEPHQEAQPVLGGLGRGPPHRGVGSRGPGDSGPPARQRDGGQDTGTEQPRQAGQQAR